MKIIDYIKTNGGTGTIECVVLGAVAAGSGCSHRTLYMIALGHKQPGPKLASAIETATNGKVSRRELRPDVFGPVFGAGAPLTGAGEGAPNARKVA